MRERRGVAVLLWLVPVGYCTKINPNHLSRVTSHEEVLQLEVWTTKSANASSLLRLASASLLAGLEARKGQISVPEPSELPGRGQLCCCVFLGFWN